MAEVKNPVFEGNWTNLPTSCPGNVEIWDQTAGCPICGMNLWYLPKFGQWPLWDKDNEPPEGWWDVDWDKVTGGDAPNPYDPYMRLFQLLHPFQFDDCHDPGDEHDEARSSN